MFVRGLIFGVSAISCLVAWLHISRGHATSPEARIEIPRADIDYAAVHRRRTSVLAQIASESPWILKPNAKPSTNS
ncbi:MAG: hypothetical protein RL076_332 [Chloroflexota bacterium]|jgi:hypothetical protein